MDALKSFNNDKAWCLPSVGLDIPFELVSQQVVVLWWLDITISVDGVLETGAGFLICRRTPLVLLKNAQKDECTVALPGARLLLHLKLKNLG